MNFLNPYAERIYAGLRILAGLMFMQHGLQKVFGLFGGLPKAATWVVWTAGPIELVGGALIAVGLFAAPAAFICSGQMAVAYLGFHWLRTGDFFPILNDGERAVLYCLVFLLIAARGSGVWSVDAARGRQ